MSVKGEDDMVLSENIYFLILFTLPAAFNIIYNTNIRHVPRKYKDKSEELAECVLFCLVVLFINSLLLRRQVDLFIEYMLLDADEIAVFVENTEFDYMDFIISYFIINMLTSIFVIGIWNLLLKRILLKIYNLINRLFGKPEITAFGDVWTNLFETNELIDINDCAIKIEKSGALVTAGLISMYQAPNEDEKEIAVYNTEFIKEIFDEDQDKEYKDRIFKQPVCEYYNIDKDILIKFYTLEQYDEIYGEVEVSPTS